MIWAAVHHDFVYHTPYSSTAVSSTNRSGYETDTFCTGCQAYTTTTGTGCQTCRHDLEWYEIASLPAAPVAQPERPRTVAPKPVAQLGRRVQPVSAPKLRASPVRLDGRGWA